MLVVVHRPRFESLEKRLAKQEASRSGRNAAFDVFDQHIADLQRPDNESHGGRNRAVSKHVLLFSRNIGFFDGARSDQGADHIGGYRDLGGAAIDDEIQRNSAVYEYRYNKGAAKGL